MPRRFSAHLAVQVDGSAACVLASCARRASATTAWTKPTTRCGALGIGTLGLQRSDLPSDIVEAAHLRLLDTIGIMLAATDTPIGRAARGGALAMGSGTSNRIVEFGDRSSAMLAALADGTLAHAMDFDDTHDPSLVHPSAAIVPTALAVGEMVGLPAELLVVLEGRRGLFARSLARLRAGCTSTG